MERTASRARIVIVVTVVLLIWLTTGSSGQEVTYERLLNADQEPHNWLMYYGNYKGWRNSPLSQINTTNIKRLVVKWAFQAESDENFQATPIVADGIMYITNGKSNIFALDAATGKMLWRYTHELPDPGKMPVRVYGAGINRGVSVANGKVLMGTWDGQFVGLDAKTGKPVWKRQVGDYEAGETFTSPPLVVKNKAILGMQALEMPNRASVGAYSVDTGELLWRFYSVPAPGEPGNETWGPGDAWKVGCGSAWLPGTYDAELNLFYIGIDNPCPMFDGQDRPGDNLYTSSIVALDPDTGKMEWYFQVNPHDLWDYGAATEPVLVDLRINGARVKALLQANKNGYFYAFDRTDGRLLYAKPYVSRINSTKGLDEKGRPIPGVVPTQEGVVFCPSLMGGKNWNHMAYSPQTEAVYIPTIDMCERTKIVRQKPRKGIMYFGGDLTFLGEGTHGLLQALDVKTGAIRWQYRSKYPMVASVLATGGDLVFTGDPVGNALAFDSSNGKLLWSFNTGSGHRGSPITYAVGGKQYVAVPAGWGGLAAGNLAQAFPEMADATKGSTLFVFGLFEE